MAASAIVVGGIAIIRLFPKNNKYVSQTQLQTLNKTVLDGFQYIREDIKELNKRINELHDARR